MKGVGRSRCELRGRGTRLGGMVANATDTTLDIPGLRVAARVWGPSEGKRVLALHGWLDNAASFDGLAPALGGHRIVALDLPGHGLSDHRAPGVAYHFVDWVTDVTAVANALGWDRFTLMGHSMGAGIACLFTGAFPRRIDRLVLLDGLGPLTLDPELAPHRLADGVTRLLATRGEPVGVLSTRQEAAARLRKATLGMTESSAATLLARGMRDVEDGVAWRTDPRLRVPSLFRLTEEHVHAFLKRIACPVLVVHAKDGYPFDAAWIHAQLGCMTDLEVVHVPGGHHVHLDEPERVAPHIVAFMRPDAPDQHTT